MNKYAKGTPGNAGGGRPPLPVSKKKRHHISAFVADALWDRLNSAAVDAGYTDYREFLREHLDRTLPILGEIS